MDTEILEQLKNIGAQLEKITKLLEEKKSFPPRKSGFGDRKPFGDKKPFGAKKPFAKGGGFAKRASDPRERFNADGSPRIIADGRGSDFYQKKRRF